jgi:hypothetical protein
MSAPCRFWKADTSDEQAKEDVEEIPYQKCALMVDGHVNRMFPHFN